MADWRCTFRVARAQQQLRGREFGLAEHADGKSGRVHFGVPASMDDERRRMSGVPITTSPPLAR